jgi:hypothetical protein
MVAPEQGMFRKPYGSRSVNKEFGDNVSVGVPLTLVPTRPSGSRREDEERGDPGGPLFPHFVGGSGTGVHKVGWDESEHPRDPGGEGGGQFVSDGGATVGNPPLPGATRKPGEEGSARGKNKVDWTDEAREAAARSPIAGKAMKELPHVGIGDGDGKTFMASNGQHLGLGPEDMVHEDVAVRYAGDHETPNDNFGRQTGFARVLHGDENDGEVGVSFYTRPSDAQLRSVVAAARKAQAPLHVDNGQAGKTLSKTFNRPTVDEVRAWVDRNMSKKVRAVRKEQWSGGGNNPADGDSFSVGPGVVGGHTFVVGTLRDGVYVADPRHPRVNPYEAIFLRRGVSLRKFAAWDESEHPRDEGGKFSESGGGGARAMPPERAKLHERWSNSPHTGAALRREMTAHVLAYGAAGSPLRSDAAVVYRGGGENPRTGVAESWTEDRDVARTFGEPVDELRLTPDIPNIARAKALPGADDSEREVVVVLPKGQGGRRTAGGGGGWTGSGWVKPSGERVSSRGREHDDMAADMGFRGRNEAIRAGYVRVNTNRMTDRMDLDFFGDSAEAKRSAAELVRDHFAGGGESVAIDRRPGDYGTFQTPGAAARFIHHGSDKKSAAPEGDDRFRAEEATGNPDSRKPRKYPDVGADMGWNDSYLSKSQEEFVAVFRAAAFDEFEHPRDESGKFSESGGGGAPEESEDRPGLLDSEGKRVDPESLKVRLRDVSGETMVSPDGQAYGGSDMSQHFGGKHRPDQTASHAQIARALGSNVSALVSGGWVRARVDGASVGVELDLSNSAAVRNAIALIQAHHDADMVFIEPQLHVHVPNASFSGKFAVSEAARWLRSLLPVEKAWDESEHPRVESGEGGGQFVSGGGGRGGEAAVETPSHPGLTTNPDSADKKALASSRASLRKLYAADSNVRDALDVATFYTQGEFSQVREYAEWAATGKISEKVAAAAAAQAALAEENNAADAKALAEWPEKHPGEPPPAHLTDPDSFGARLRRQHTGLSSMGTIKALNGDEIDAMSMRDAVNGVARLQDMIATSPPADYPVYRGLAFRGTYGTRPGTAADYQTPEDAARWRRPDGSYEDQPDYGVRVSGVDRIPRYEVGQRLSFVGPSSFTRDARVADDFADGVAGKEKGPNRLRNEQHWRPPEGRLIVELERGARGLNMDAVSPWPQKEFVTQGEFEVVSVKDEDRGYRGEEVKPGRPPSFRTRRVVLRQVAVYRGSPYRVPDHPRLNQETVRKPKGTK